MQYSQQLWNYCTENQITFLYASSAATYGSGMQGFDDEKEISLLEPLNGYGYSKQFFDLWAEKQRDHPYHYAGFKFFNVYGPNEYFKGSMASMVFHGYQQIIKEGVIRLFQSENRSYRDGEQLRDFVYVKDVCDVIMFFLDQCVKNGLFNVGTGRAQSFRGLAEAVFKALHRETCIEYIPMPEQLQQKYQYYTQANIEKLRKAGYEKEFYDLTTGVEDYVRGYLCNEYATY